MLYNKRKVGIRLFDILLDDEKTFPRRSAETQYVQYNDLAMAC